MVPEWTSSEKLRLLILYKAGVEWASAAEKMNVEYRERPKNHFNEKNCKAEFDRICNEPCPIEITPEEPEQSYKRATVIEAWITHLKEQVKLDTDKMVEIALVELREKTKLIERIMSKDRPSAQEMSAKLAELREESKKSNRDAAAIERVERVESALRARFTQIFKEQRESDGNADVGVPTGSLSISPTKQSNVTLQPAFRSPSPIKSPMTSPIRPLAEAIEEADAEMGEMMLDVAEEPKVEVESPVASPLSKTSSSTGKREKDKASTVSPRTAADRAIGEGGLEEEMEEEEEEEEEVKEEPMEVDEAVGEKKPVSTRKSTRASTASVETSVSSGKEKRKKDPSPVIAESTPPKKEEESRARRSSMRGKPPSTPVLSAAVTPTTPLQQAAAEVAASKPSGEEKEEGARTRRSSRVEKPEEKEEEEGVTKRVTRRSMVEKEAEKAEESESKEEVTFVAPSVSSRTRNHRGSEQAEEKEKEKSEEPSVPKTRAGNRSSLNAKAGSESKDSPSPSDKKPKRGEKKDEEVEEKEKEKMKGNGGQDSSIMLPEKSLVAVGGKKESEVGTKRDVEMNTEVSIRHPIAPPTPISPSKTRRGTERESPSTPLARKSSRVSSVSSNSGKRESVMVSVEVQTEKVEMRQEDEVYVSYNSNESYFNPVCELDKGKAKSKKEIKTENEEEKEKEKEKPISRRTRGGEVSEDEGGSRSGSFSQSDRGTPSRRKEGKRDQMTLHLDVDDDTGRYWMKNGAIPVEPIADPRTSESLGPSANKRKSALVAEMSGRRSMVQMDPMKAALFKACKDMELHRHSSVFKANVAQKDAPDYYECVHKPVCLSKMKTDVMDGEIKDPVSLMRQFAIMFMNGAMYNSTAHDYWMYAVEMNKETYKPVREIMPEMMVEEEEVPKTRARRNNEPAFAKDAMLCDRDRSMTLDRLFKCESVDGDEMDTSGEDHRALYSRNKVDSTRKRKI